MTTLPSHDDFDVAPTVSVADTCAHKNTDEDLPVSEILAPAPSLDSPRPWFRRSWSACFACSADAGDAQTHSHPIYTAILDSRC